MKQICPLCIMFVLFAIFMQTFVGEHVYAQPGTPLAVSVRQFPILLQLTDNEQLFPKRTPTLISGDDVTGVYNDTTQTMTLTYPQPPHRRAQAWRICRFVCGQRPHL